MLFLSTNAQVEICGHACVASSCQVLGRMKQCGVASTSGTKRTIRRRKLSGVVFAARDTCGGRGSSIMTGCDLAMFLVQSGGCFEGHFSGDLQLVQISPDDCFTHLHAETFR